MSIRTRLLAAIAAFPISTIASAACTFHTISVPANASNYDLTFASTYDLTTPAGVESFLSSGAGFLGQLASFIPVSGTYEIAAKWCPAVANASAPAGREKEVQVLLHGVPYNSTYWFGLPGNPDGSSKYDWVTYATNQGYPVLALDNLGAGDSQKADPIIEVQQPLQTEILHAITQMLRKGQLSFATQAEKVIFVGHSLASVQGNGIATHYPSDFDALILTGYSYDLLPASLGLLLTFVEPASIQNAARHGTLPPGYLAYSSATGKRDSYYAMDGSFSSSLAAYDFAHEDTITIGQIYSAFSGLERADAFTGDALVLTGQEDAFFCGPTGTLALGPQSCGIGDSSIPAMSKSFWENADFEYYLAPSTSHATTLHYSAPGSIERAHAFLAGKGY